MNKKYQQASKYLNDMSDVKGWFQYGAGVLTIAVDMLQQGLTLQGDILEIGVYQGKSGLLLSHLLEASEQCVLVDSFDKNDMPEVYGEGNLEILINNIKRFSFDKAKQIKIKKITSDSLRTMHELESFNFRIMHVDGEHTHEAALKDLRYCSDMINTQGCIIFDDAFNANQPGVNQALNEFLTTSDFVVFAIGYNKALMCHKTMYKTYIDFDKSASVQTLLDKDNVLVQGRLQKFYNFDVKLCYNKSTNKTTKLERIGHITKRLLKRIVLR